MLLGAPPPVHKHMAHVPLLIEEKSSLVKVCMNFETIEGFGINFWAGLSWESLIFIDFQCFLMIFDDSLIIFQEFHIFLWLSYPSEMQ